MEWVRGKTETKELQKKPVPEKLLSTSDKWLCCLAQEIRKEMEKLYTNNPEISCQVFTTSVSIKQDLA